MNNVVSIGICKGCLRRNRLEDGGCEDCRGLGPRWAELCDKVRNNPDFARMVYARMTSDLQRRSFLDMFGKAVDHLRIRRVL